jgi:phosphoserine phosphatase
MTTNPLAKISPRQSQRDAGTQKFSHAAVHFVKKVLSQHPQIAVFDCDGTLWAGDSGEQFLYWELKRGLLPPTVAEWIKPRYRDYQAGRVSEEDMCGEMVTIHNGLRDEDLYQAGEEFYAEKFCGAAFPEMFEITSRLRESGCQLWAVSSTNEWVVRAGARRFGIPDEHVIAASVHIEGGKATDRLKRVPSGPDKAVAIRELIGDNVDAVFGNSIHDADMLALARRAFAINPNPDLQRIAEQRGWAIYFPMGTAAHKENLPEE